MEEFFATQNIWLVAFIIFLIRVVNISLDTVRMLTMMRGMRSITFILGIFETLLFV